MFTRGWLGRRLSRDAERVALALVLWATSFIWVTGTRAFVVEPFRISSGAMTPTLLIGDHVMVAKYAYGLRSPIGPRSLVTWRTPARGDVIVYRGPKDEGVTFVHRVVGVPGDTVAFARDVVVLNGVAQAWEPTGPAAYKDSECVLAHLQGFDEDLGGRPHAVLVNDGPAGYLADVAAVTVPEGQLFVAGDNRDASADSRSAGLVPVENVAGKVMQRWLSWDACEGAWGGLRSGRFLTVVDGRAP